MKKVLIIAVACALVTVTGAIADSVVGSKHDLSSAGGSTTFRSNNISEVCVFCHTPHQPDAPFFDVDPLWNHALSTVAAYGVYDSTTLNATPAELGGGTAVSNLCMSCHDGTIGLGSLMNDPNNGGTPSNSALLISGNALVGTDLTNDHPVNFDYDTALMTEDGGLNDPTAAPINGWLFAGSLQCASCHDVHDPLNTPFLRISNDASDLCIACHSK